MYGIHYDPTEQVLHLRLEGFWTEATLADFAGELLKTVKTLHAQGRRYAVLSDSSRFPIQSPQVAAGCDGDGCLLEEVTQRVVGHRARVRRRRRRVGVVRGRMCRRAWWSRAREGERIPHTFIHPGP